MKKLLISLIILASLSFTATAKDKKDEKKQFGIKFHGWVRYDMSYDTRQTLAPRGLQVPLYPLGKNINPLNEDINDHGQFSSSATQTRLKGIISGPNAFGAKTSGIIEADFTSKSKDANLRLRRAFMKLSWAKTSLLIGQEWHPNFNFTCFPGVLTWGAGAPYHFFSRDPQVRFTYKDNGFKITTAFLTRNGNNTKVYAANSGTAYEQPELNLQLEYGNGTIFTGGGIGYKSLTPDISSVEQAKQSLQSKTANFFVKVKQGIITFKTEASYYENATDGVMIGGYGVKSFDNGIKKFTNFATASAWAELIANIKNFEFGFFAGYTENLGTKDDLYTNAKNEFEINILGKDIQSLIRFAPRVVVKSGNFSFGGEITHDIALYNDKTKENSIDSKYKIKETYTVKNTRFILSAKYTF